MNDLSKTKSISEIMYSGPFTLNSTIQSDSKSLIVSETIVFQDESSELKHFIKEEDKKYNNRGHK